MNIFIAEIRGDHALLSPEESFHCAKVLRYQPGDSVRLIDGKGAYYDAVLEKVHEKGCEAKIVSGPVHDAPRNYRFHLAVAPTKQIDRMEWMVEKCVEAGMDEISFFHSANSERTVVKADRIRRIAESAVKQSLQSKLPVVNELRPLQEVIASSTEELRLIAHCWDEPRTPISQIQFAGKSILVLIGPEGDFNLDEIRLATSRGFGAVRLTGTRLRTETAGVFACFSAALLTASR